MELFDKRFVHFMWDDELEGKKCFVSDNIGTLKEYVEHDENRRCLEVTKGNDNYPFRVDWSVVGPSDNYQFAYYDPNYEVKKAFNEGKTIQYKALDTGRWCDFDPKLGPCSWNDTTKYRVKPEDEKCIVYLQRYDEECWLSTCYECEWEEVQEKKRAMTKLFVGSEDEVTEWCKTRQKFVKEIKAWEDGKEIQFYSLMQRKWETLNNPSWDCNWEYRVKPECPCRPRMDSKACVGCEHSEDGKPHTFENYHCYVCDKSDKKYRPYESSAEMIVDFIDRFKVNCPSHCEPMIWVKNKDNDACFLVFAFYETFIKFNDDEPLMFKELFDDYTYLDGSPCGMEVSE